MSESEPIEGPEFEVWNHLESGLQQARDDMTGLLSADDFDFWDGLAEQLLALRVGLVVNPSGVNESESLTKVRPHIPSEMWRDVLLSLDQDPSKWSPWLRHAVELRIAGNGVWRAEEALARYVKLRAEIVGRAVPEKALPYLDEVLHTFLFGFDAATIALACSAFEQMAKHALVALGFSTDAQLRREQPTAESLRMHLRRHELLGDADPLAQRLIERRNSVLHKGFFEERIMPSLSLDSVKELVAVAVALSPSWSVTA